MSLSIEDSEAQTLAELIAAKTGLSLEDVVVIALREKLARLNDSVAEDRISAMLAIAQNCASRLSKETLALDHGELLYDEMGVPK